jgi:hypothetical protein
MNDGFVSIVESDDKDDLLVRSRRRVDLESFLNGLNYEIRVNQGTDYKYRAIVPRDVVQEILVDKVSGINYDNFKNSVVDDDLHQLYNLFWHLHMRYQR